MSNQLKMQQVNTLRTLLEKGWSQRRVARELAISRSTVARYVKIFASENSNDAISTPGNDTKAPSNQAISTPGKSGRLSDCEEYRARILEKFKAGLSAKRIHQDLISEEKFTGSYQSVKRFIRSISKDFPLPFRRMETKPGEEAQVDFGQGSLTERGKVHRRPHLFRMVLSFSRLGYTETCWTQSTDDFIRCMENGFHHFGGVPQTVSIDNLKAGVLKADWYDPIINPKFASFERHYGFAVMPCKARMPRHKGKVEAGVKYCQENGAKGRRFETIEKQNIFWAEWERNTADCRIHGTTQRQVRNLFEKDERDKLLPLPNCRFPLFDEAERKVHRDGHVALKNSYYSVPPEYVSRKVWVRWDDRLVRIFNTRLEKIAVHARVTSGKFSTDPNHIPAEKKYGAERGVDYMLERARVIGPNSRKWSDELVVNRGIKAVRVLQGFLNLTSHFLSSEIEEACRVARSHNAFHLSTLKQLLKRSEGEQLYFMERHPVIREMKVYGDLVEFTSWQHPKKGDQNSKPKD